MWLLRGRAKSSPIRSSPDEDRTPKEDGDRPEMAWKVLLTESHPLNYTKREKERKSFLGGKKNLSFFHAWPVKAKWKQKQPKIKQIAFFSAGELGKEGFLLRGQFLLHKQGKNKEDERILNHSQTLESDLGEAQSIVVSTVAITICISRLHQQFCCKKIYSYCKTRVFIPWQKAGLDQHYSYSETNNCCETSFRNDCTVVFWSSTVSFIPFLSSPKSCHEGAQQRSFLLDPGPSLRDETFPQCRV